VGERCFLLVGLSLLATAGCTPVLRSTGAERQARRQFSEEAFCPEQRVVAERVIPIPAPPPPIANDPERLAMWRRAHEAHARADPRQTIAVSGCGEQETYYCWDLGAPRARHKGKGPTVFAYVGTSCNEAPRRDQGSILSTTSEGQPKTTASSR
jgi:hypothetical protein